jgi:hypothetical protein
MRGRAAAHVAGILREFPRPGVFISQFHYATSLAAAQSFGRTRLPVASATARIARRFGGRLPDSHPCRVVAFTPICAANALCVSRRVARYWCNCIPHGCTWRGAVQAAIRASKTFFRVVRIFCCAVCGLRAGLSINTEAHMTEHPAYPSRETVIRHSPPCAWQNVSAITTPGSLRSCTQRLTSSPTAISTATA